jgi:hypothetical protein
MAEYSGNRRRLAGLMAGAFAASNFASLTAQLNNVFNATCEAFDQLPGAERSIDVVLSARF